MKLEKIDFQTWLNAQSHQEKNRFDIWSREEYPWPLFTEIDFDAKLINKSQKILVNDTIFTVQIIKIDTANAGRCKAVFKIETHLDSEGEQWTKRKWDDVFEIIYTQRGYFVTVYIKGTWENNVPKDNDDYKRHLRNFKDGDFSSITKDRSLPLLFLLFRTMASLIFLKKHPCAQYLHLFEYDSSKPQGRYKWKSKKITPMWSIEKKLWYFSSNTEEKAHRLGMMLCHQCEQIVIVYGKPIHTSYEICNEPNVTILSLFEFSDRVPSCRYEYDKHMLFLLNELNAIDDRPFVKLIQHISEIGSNAKPYIELHHLREALTINSLPVYNIFELFYSLSCALILNTWQDYTQNVVLKKYDKRFRYNQKVYTFKKYLPTKIHDVLKNNIDGIDVFCSRESEINASICFFRLFGFQFSFHVVPLDTLADFMKSEKNKPQEWAGKRLKHVTILLLILSRKVYYWSEEVMNLAMLTVELYCEKDANGWFSVDELYNKLNQHYMRRSPLEKEDFIRQIIKKQEKKKDIFEKAEKNGLAIARVNRFRLNDEDKAIWDFVFDKLKNSAHSDVVCNTHG
jgi:hypothetical protein